jgi:hypothetical protein
MQIKFNNTTCDYDVIDNGNVLFSSGDSYFNKKESEYYFLKEHLHLNNELIHSYDNYSVSYDNFDEVTSVDLFDSNGKHIRRIDSSEIESILNSVDSLNMETFKNNKKELFLRIDSIKNGTPSHYDYLNDTTVSDLEERIKNIDFALAGGVVFDGKNGREIISFLKSVNVQSYQEDNGRLRALIGGKMETIFKDDKVSVKEGSPSIVKPELYSGSSEIGLSDIRGITLQEKEDGDYEFLVSYSFQYSETPEYDTFNKTVIQKMFKDMSQDEFRFNIVPYLDGKELENMLDAVYPSRNDNISLSDALCTVITSEGATNTIDSSFPETDVISISEIETLSIEELKEIRDGITAEKELSKQKPVVLNNTDALVSYILNSDSHNVSDLLDAIENNFGTEHKDSFLESFQKYTDDPLDSYYNSSVLLSVFSDDISNLSEELGENEEQNNLYSLGVQ